MMQFTSFFEEFPELVNREFRHIFITNDSVIPPGNYAFAEFYCPDIECDCRKVIIQILTADPYKAWAVIDYGWESEKYYKKWFGKSRMLYVPMSGDYLNPLFANNLIAKELLKIFKDTIKNDKIYANRLEAHYSQFKQKILEQQNLNTKNKTPIKSQRKTYARISRNAPCPCESGRKFKNCCSQSTV